MSWRAHPTRFVSMPAVLPLSIPPGSRASELLRWGIGDAIVKLGERVRG